MESRQKQDAERRKHKYLDELEENEMFSEEDIEDILEFEDMIECFVVGQKVLIFDPQ